MGRTSRPKKKFFPASEFTQIIGQRDAAALQLTAIRCTFFNQHVEHYPGTGLYFRPQASVNSDKAASVYIFFATIGQNKNSVQHMTKKD